MALEEVVREVQARLEAGDVDGALELRQGLGSAWAGEPLGSATTALARAIGTELNLIRFQFDDAEAALEPYLDIASGTANERLVTPLIEAEPRIAGRLLSAMGNLLFRRRRYSESAALFEQARGLLSSVTDPVRLFNLAYLARARWRQGQASIAEGLFARFWELFGDAPKRNTGGMKLAEAFALDVSSSIDWTRGRLDEGRRKIYRALYLLRDPTVKDSVRLGSACYAAGKLESTRGDAKRMLTACDLLDEALNHLSRYPLHPLAIRVQIQRAQTLVKAESMQEANEQLQNIPTNGERHLEAEVALTRCWMADRQDQFEEAERLARKLVDLARSIPGEPHRVLAEGLVQHGRALIRPSTPSKANLDKAIEVLEEGRRLAAQMERPKIEALGCIALARALNLRDRAPSPDQNDLFRRASELTALTRSTYLERQLSVLRLALQRPWTHEVRTDAWDTELRAFQQRFAEHLIAKYDTVREAASKAKMNEQRLARARKGEGAVAVERRAVARQGRKRRKS